jgi:hypothetical protein
VQRAKRFVSEHACDTIILQYGSDVTPLVTKERYEAKFDGLHVIRGGHSTQEYLIQRVFVQALTGPAVAIMEVPIAMGDKTAFAHFAACRALLKTPREMGHSGLCISFHKYDRAIQTPLDRLHRKFQAALDDKSSEDLHLGQSYRLWITNWWFCVGCFAHDCHGGLKWSILNFTKDKECMRSTFLLYETLRHAYDLLVKHVASWLRSVVVFRDWTCRDAELFYQLLDVDESWLETYVDLEIRFVGGQLLIAERHRGRIGLHDLLITIMLKTWHFRRFSDGRFVSMGRSSRQLVLSMALGLEHLIGFVIKQGGSQYYIGHFVKHCTQQVKLLSCLVAMCSRVSDSILSMTMKDDRVPIMLPAIDAQMHAELDRLTAIPMSIWQFLGTMCNEPAARLRSNAISAAVHPLATSRGIFGKLAVGHGPCSKAIVVATFWNSAVALHQKMRSCSRCTR